MKVCVGQRDRVRPPDPLTRRAAPPGVALDVLPDGVLRRARLVHRVEGAGVVARLAPLTVDHADAAALDLHDDDAGPRDDRHDVSLVVLHLIAEPEVGHEHVVRPELSPEDLPDLALRGRLELGVRGEEPGRHQLARGSAIGLSLPCGMATICASDPFEPHQILPLRYDCEQAMVWRRPRVDLSTDGRSQLGGTRGCLGAVQAWSSTLSIAL